MESVLEDKFKRLQDQLEPLKSMIMATDDSRLNHSPVPGKWSALQIMWHLQQSEYLSVNYLNKKLSGGPYPLTNSKTRARILLLKWALASPLKFQAPAAVRENMPEILDKNDLFTAYDNNRRDLAAILDTFPKSRMKEAIYKHPRVGYINIRQTLDFLYWHFIHHEKQIRSILNS